MLFSRTKKILNVLLEHHRLTCLNKNSSEQPISSFLITYGKLQRKTGIAGPPTNIGSYLDDIATWCAENHHPPINALAVNKAEQEPGEGYELAEGCSMETWPTTVKEVVEWKKYPNRV